MSKSNAHMCIDTSIALSFFFSNHTILDIERSIEIEIDQDRDRSRSVERWIERDRDIEIERERVTETERQRKTEAERDREKKGRDRGPHVPSQHDLIHTPPGKCVCFLLHRVVEVFDCFKQPFRWPPKSISTIWIFFLDVGSNHGILLKEKKTLGYMNNQSIKRIVLSCKNLKHLPYMLGGQGLDVLIAGKPAELCRKICDGSTR